MLARREARSPRSEQLPSCSTIKNKIKLPREKSSAAGRLCPRSHSYWDGRAPAARPTGRCSRGGDVAGAVVRGLLRQPAAKRALSLSASLACRFMYYYECWECVGCSPSTRVFVAAPQSAALDDCGSVTAAGICWRTRISPKSSSTTMCGAHETLAIVAQASVANSVPSVRPPARRPVETARSRLDPRSAFRADGR